MKEKIKKYLLTFKKVIKEFPVTFSMLVTMSVLAVVLTNKDFRVIEYLLTYSVLFGIGSFLIESLEKRKDWLFIINGIISLILTYLLFTINTTITSFLFRFTLFYVISIILLGILFNYKKCKKDFSNYLLTISSSLLKFSIIYSVIQTGCILLIVLFQYLILNKINENIILDSYILLTGIFYIPSIIYCLQAKNEISEFVKTLITKIFFPLMCIAYIIIYIYIIKILITQNMPSNIIFAVLSILFIGTAFISTMSKNHQENKLFEKINEYIPIIFIPFIILQMYSLGIRINRYGITISRYAGIIILLIEIIYTILKLSKKDEHYNFYSLIVLSFIALVMPLVNGISLSLINQKEIILNNYNSNIKKASSAYHYIINIDDKYLNDVLSKDQIKKLKEQDIYEYDQDYIYLNYIVDNNDINIDIDNYNHLYKYNITSENFDNSKCITDKMKLEIENKIKDYINNYKNNNNSEDYNYFKNNNTIIIDDYKIVIIETYIDYENDKVEFYSATGFLLMK